MDDITQRIPSALLEELEKALDDVSYGSIEIFVQDKVVTQITVRNIRKTSVGIGRSSRSQSGGLGQIVSAFEKSRTIKMSLGNVKESKASPTGSKKMIHPRINAKSEVQIKLRP